MVVFWVAVLVGGLFAWCAVRAGFLSSWVLFCSALLSAYMAVFLTAYVVTLIPSAAELSFGCALTLVSLAVGTFFLCYGLCYASMSGKFQLVFPDMLDTVGSGVLGFLGGFLFAGVLAIAIALTPWSQKGVLESCGLNQINTPTTKYVCWWCNRVHSFIGRSDDDGMKLAMELWGRTRIVEEPAPNYAVPVIVAAPAPPVEPPKPVKGPQKPLPGGTPTLDEQLASRRAFITSPGEIGPAIANPNIRIIEVANVCTAEKFTDPAQIKSLQDWVTKGGVLWTTNDVLTLFGVPHSKPLEGDGELSSLVADSAEVADILKDCKKVAVKDASDRVYVLSLNKNILPLLKVETDVSSDLKAGTADWSMIPYGKGWISDPKPVDTAQYDSERFWLNFCLFCLRQTAAPPPAPPVKKKLVLFGKEKGSLFGVWVSPGGESVIIDDNQAYLTFRLTKSPVLQKLEGTLQRVGAKGDVLKYRGILTVRFVREAVDYQLDTTIMALGSENVDNLHLTLAKCPLWDKRGIKYFGVLKVDLERAEGDWAGHPPPALLKPVK